MIFSLGCLAHRTTHKREIVMRVAGIFVSHERCFEMSRGSFVFTASIIGQTQSNVCRRKTGIAFQRFCVSIARFALFALLIKRQTLDVALFSTR